MRKTASYFLMGIGVLALVASVLSQPVSAETVNAAPTAKPDLKVVTSEMSFSPSKFVAGAKITLKAKVRNVGQAKATAIKVAFLVDGTKVYEKTLTTLAIVSQSQVTYSYTTLATAVAPLVFSVNVDPDQAIAESDETNNSAQISIPVTAATRELVVESFKPSIPKPKTGQKVNWSVKVRNNGTVKATNVPVAIYLGGGGTPVVMLTIASIGVKGLSPKSWSWTVPAGLDPAKDYPVRVVVDPDNAIAEANKLDNAKTYLLTLTASDLSLRKESNAKITYRGSYTAINLRVFNDKVAAVPAVKVVYYYLQANGTRVKLDEKTIGIAKNWSESVYLAGKLPETIPLGTAVRTLAVIDPDKFITDFDRSNNEVEETRTVVEKPRTVQGPYLSVSVAGEDGTSANGVAVQIKNNATGAIETKTTGVETFYDSNGTVVFESRPETASYTVTVTKAGYRFITETFDYSSSSEASQFKAYYLDKKAVLEGVVKDQAGQPLQWATVKITDTGLEAVTDSSGRYGFLLNGGGYTVRFMKPGFARQIVQNLSILPLTSVTLDKVMAPTGSGYVYGTVTDDDGNPLNSVDVYVNGIMLGTSNASGKFSLTVIAGDKAFKFKKPGFVETQFSQAVEAGQEYGLDFVMYKPVTANHAERGANIVSWHQHEGTPANAYFIPEYNVDVWWGLGRVKMAMDYTGSGSTTKLTKLTVNNHGLEWECNRVEGEGSVETSAIDIPVTVAAGSCSTKKTQMDVYKVAIESNGTEVWSDSSFWTSASDPMNTGTKTFDLANLAVDWNGDLKVKMWVRVQKRAVIGTDGDGAGALVGYHLDKKLVTWHPQRPPTTKISTSWSQIGGYFLGILDNPVTAITSFTDLFTVEQFDQFDMTEVLPGDFPGAPPAY